MSWKSESISRSILYGNVMLWDSIWSYLEQFVQRFIALAKYLLAMPCQINVFRRRNGMEKNSSAWALDNTVACEFMRSLMLAMLPRSLTSVLDYHTLTNNRPRICRQAVDSIQFDKQSTTYRPTNSRQRAGGQAFDNEYNDEEFRGCLIQRSEPSGAQ